MSPRRRAGAGGEDCPPISRCGGHVSKMEQYVSGVASSFSRLTGLSGKLVSLRLRGGPEDVITMLGILLAGASILLRNGLAPGRPQPVGLSAMISASISRMSGLPPTEC